MNDLQRKWQEYQNRIWTRIFWWFNWERMRRDEPKTWRERIAKAREVAANGRL